MAEFKFTLRTPENELLDAKVLSLTVMTEGGEMQLLAHHASLTASVVFSPLKVEFTDGKEELFMVRNGMLLFDNQANTSTLLALYAEPRAEVMKHTVEEYMAFIKKELSEGKELSAFQIKYLEGEQVAVEAQLQSMK